MHLGAPDQARRIPRNAPRQLRDTLPHTRVHRAPSPPSRPKPRCVEPILCSSGVCPGSRLSRARRDFLHDTSHPLNLRRCGSLGQARGGQVRQVALRCVRRGRSPLPRSGCSLYDRGRVEHRLSLRPPRERRRHLLTNPAETTRLMNRHPWRESWHLRVQNSSDVQFSWLHSPE